MENLINKLRQHSIDIDVIDDKLKLHVPNGFNASEILDEIRANKEALIAFIKKSKLGSDFTSIETSPIKSSYLLSSAQRRLHFLNELDKDSLAYNMPQVVKLKGQLDVNRLANTFSKVIERHESFRTFFELEDGLPVQKIVDHVDFSIDMYSIADGNIEVVADLFVRPFDLSKSPLLRVGLMVISEDEHYLLLDMHHIITDGVSHGILLQNFMSIYNNEELAPLNLQYKDYAEWQQSEEQQKEMASHRDFWLDKFADDTTVLDLPGDFSRPAINSYQGDMMSFELDINQSEELHAIAEKNGITMFMMVLSLYNILLSKLGNQEDIVVGTPIAGREHADLEGIIGMFVNTLPLRNYPKGDVTFTDFLNEVKVETLGFFEHQSYQYEELIDELKVERDLGRNPLFDVMFSYANHQDGSFDLPELQLESYTTKKTISKFDLTLSATEHDRQLYFNIEYSTDLFKASTIERFVSYFKRIADAVIADPNATLSSINVLSIEEQQEQLETFNATAKSFPSYNTVLDIFEAQAKLTPDNAAIKSNEEVITYVELSDQSNRIAAYLQKEKGIKKGDLVGLIFQRDPSMIAVIFGVLKAGAAYIPMSPNYPKERIDTIIEDANIQLMLTQGAYSMGCPSVNYSALAEDILGTDTSNFEAPNTNNEDLAYLIYTSGSTGKPKGVMIEHGSLLNVIQDQNDCYALNADDNFLLKTTYTFDVSISEIFGWFFDGGSLSILKDGEEGNPREIINTIEKHESTHVNFVPSMFSIFLEELTLESNLAKVSSLKHIFLAGEALPVDLVRQFNALNSDIKIENIYGPTEATIYSSKFSVENLKNGLNVPIGKPVANLQMHVLDSSGNLIPRGVAGELCIGGVGLARGYMNNEALTNQVFVEYPTISSGKLYRTGDLVRWLEDGNIEYLGRIDNQVKVRGFRIELGEIGTNLSAHPQVRESVVVAKDRGGDKYLVAYYLSDVELETKDLTAHLSKKLPEYMIPFYFVKLDRFPTSRNGKLDRKLLPDPEITGGEDYVAPRNEVEERLVSIWSEVLKIDAEQISVHANFFELGGHSLKAAFLINKVHREFDVAISLNEIFKNQDIDTLGKCIENSNKTVFSQIKKAEEKEFYPITTSQKQMYFSYAMDASSTINNMYSTVQISGTLDIERFNRAIKELVARHESLRTSFEMVNGEPVQKINETCPFEPEFIETNRQGLQSKIDEFIRPFDLNQAPLIRTGLFNVENSFYVFTVDIHHIVADGVSTGVLIEDFMTLYQGGELAEIGYRYRDFSEWELSKENQVELERQKEYWINEFEDDSTFLELPRDFEKTDDTSQEGSTVSFKLEEEDSANLKSIAKEEGTTMFVVMLSIFNVFLSKLVNQEDIIIGTPVAARTRSEFQSIVGVFINTLHLRNKPKGELSFIEFLRQVHVKSMKSLDAQSYVYNEIEIGSTGWFDVMFAYQNFDMPELVLGDLKIEGFETEIKLAMKEFSLVVHDIRSELELHIEYSKELFKPETIARFVDYFKKVISIVSSNKEIKLMEIDPISVEEKEELIVDFNDNVIDFNADHSMLTLFESQVAANPNNGALKFGDVELTYTEFNDRANQFGNYLKSHGVTQGSVVGIMVDRSINMMVVMIGIMKAGGTYLPLDGDQSSIRNIGMLEETDAQFLVVDTRFEAEYKERFSTLSVNDSEIEKFDSENCQTELNGDDIAYIIYTSGSTGKPKGVEVYHKGVVNLVASLSELYKMNSDDVVLQFSSILFDASIEQIWLALGNGGKLVLLTKDELLSRTSFNTILKESKVTHIDITPSFIENLGIDPQPSLKRIVLGGEATKVSTLEKYVKDYKIYNTYGPTETTVTSVATELTQEHVDAGRVPIGKPLGNTNVYVLDKALNLIPKGAIGELHISGTGVTKGYLKDEVRTHEKFVDNPFHLGTKMYKTGDLVKWAPDGNLEFLGRIDHQVKIRGFRIELGEIESQLVKHSDIREAVVIAKKDKGEPVLIAYYTSNKELRATVLSEFLSDELMNYMVPAYFVQLDEIPLNVSGKVNAKLLPEPVYVAGENYEAPTSEIELKLCVIWAKVLGVDESIIGVNSTFFELGGHSLKAVNLIAQLEKEFNFKMKLMTFFTKPTIRELEKNILMSTLNKKPSDTAKKLTI